MKAVARISALAVFAVLVAACYAAPAASPSGGASTGTSSLSIASPAEGANLPGNEVAVSVKATNFTIGSQGHIHMKLDGGAISMVYGESHTIAGVPAGKHTLEVELVNNDHSSLNPPVKKTVSFSTAAAGSGAAPSRGYDY